MIQRYGSNAGIEGAERADEGMLDVANAEHRDMLGCCR